MKITLLKSALNRPKGSVVDVSQGHALHYMKTGVAEKNKAFMDNFGKKSVKKVTKKKVTKE